MAQGPNDRKRQEQASARPEDDSSFSSGLDSVDVSIPEYSAQPAKPSSNTSLAPGDLLANRFRILRFVARGGMGEVYEAEDHELGENVAVKTLLPEIAENPEDIARFKREIQLARKVSHPNVCRTFELVRDEGKPGVAGRKPVTFLTMQFLAGETLAAALRRKGRFSTTELLPLARQMAEGLAAAHEAEIEIIHQDFKTANVMLVPSSRGHSVRAVVTDFGLAQRVEGEGSTAVVARGGTPDYMAPEQVPKSPFRGITRATDVFSFGVVLYELVTGRLPYPAATREQAMRKRLEEAPVPPSRFVPELSADWERVILRCLERDPAKRYRDAIDAVRELEGSGRRTVKLVVAAIVLCAALGASLYLWRFVHRVPPIPRLGVVALNNETGETALQWVSTGFAETLANALDSGKSLQAVRGDQVAYAIEGLAIPNDRLLSSSDLFRLRDAIGAPYIVDGGFRLAGSDKLHVSLRLNGPDGRVLDTFEGDATKAEPEKLAADAASRFRLKLGDAAPLDIDPNSIYPPDLEARRLYFEARAQLRNFNATAALQLLQKARERDDSSPLIHSAIADALAVLRQDSEAAKEANQAANMASKNTALPLEFRTLLAARAAEMSHRWPDAEPLYNALFISRQADLTYGLKLASVQISQKSDAKLQAALSTLADLQKFPPPLNDDPGIYIENARAQVEIPAQRPAAIESAKTAIRIAQQRNALPLKAQANLELCWVYQQLGNVDDAFTACDEAQQTFNVFGDKGTAAVALNGLAVWLDKRGKYDRAKEAYQKVIDIHRTAQDYKDLAGALLNSANVSIEMNKPQEAEDLLTQALDAAPKGGDSDDLIRIHIALAEVYRSIGDTTRQQQQIQAALNLSDSGTQEAKADALSQVGLAEEEAGDLPAALEHHEKALAIRIKGGNPEKIANSSMYIGDSYFRIGNLKEASKRYKDAEANYTKAKTWGSLGQAQLALADVDLENGLAKEASAKAEKILENFKGEPDDKKDVLAFLVRALVGQGSISQAEIRLKDMKNIFSSDLEVKSDAALAEGVYLTASGPPRAALAVLEDAASETERTGHHYAALELRLAAAQARLRAGDLPAAREEFSSISSTAKRYGFGLVAQKASTLAAK